MMGIFSKYSFSDKTGNAGQIGLHGVPGQKVPDGKNYHMDNKKSFNLDTQDDFKIGVDYDTMVKDLKSAVNKEYLEDKFLEKDKDGNYLDLRQNVVRNTEPYYDGLFGDNDFVSKA